MDPTRNSDERQPRRTQEERTQQTQEKLIRSAIEQLKKRRYAALRMMDVAEHAGLSKGAASQSIGAV